LGDLFFELLIHDENVNKNSIATKIFVFIIITYTLLIFNLIIFCYNLLFF